MATKDSNFGLRIRVQSGQAATAHLNVVGVDRVHGITPRSTLSRGKKRSRPPTSAVQTRTPGGTPRVLIPPLAVPTNDLQGRSARSVTDALRAPYKWGGVKDSAFVTTGGKVPSRESSLIDRMNSRRTRKRRMVLRVLSRHARPIWGQPGPGVK